MKNLLRKKLLLLSLFLSTSIADSWGQNYAIIGTATTNTGTAIYNPFRNSTNGNRQQYFVAAAELAAAGLSAGDNINSVGFDIHAVNAATTLSNWQVKVYTTATLPANTNTTFVGTPEGESTPSTLDVSSTGWTQTSISEVTWNGTDHLVVETCYRNTSWNFSYASVKFTQIPSADRLATRYSRYVLNDNTSICSDNINLGDTQGRRPNIRIGYIAPCSPHNTPTISTVAATCSAEGTATVTNYDEALTYTFTPAGPTVGAGGVINSATAGTSYTVTAGNGSCSSAASEAFTIEAQLQPSTTIAGVVIPDEAYLWGGETSTSWTVASNWYRRTGSGYAVATVVPTTTRDVYIFPTASDACITSFIPRVNAPDLTARNVYIANDATLEFINTTSLDVYGDFTNKGSLANDNSTDELSGDRTIRFRGAAASQELNSGGTGANKSFANLEINKSSGEVTLKNNNLHVSGDVILTSGNLKLNQRVLDLGSTGKLENESNDNYVYCNCPSAYIRSTGLINTASVAFDLGNLGLSITPSSGKPLGDVEIKRHHQRLIDEDGMTVSITRYYDVKKNSGGPVDNNGSLNANIKVAYLRHELGEITEEELSIYRQPIGESSWLEYGGSVNTATQEVWFDNWDAFSLVTLSEFNSPLPVQFLGMELACQRGNEVIINWSTASENNSNYFEIERSRDGYTWTIAGEVPAAGNSSTQTNYSFTDTGLGPNFEGYYRLRQFDMDGQWELFAPMSLFCNENKIGRVEIYPNPSDGNVNLFIYAEHGMEGLAHIRLVDATGRTVIIDNITVINGAIMYPINIENKQSGMYFLKITFANGQQLGAKLIKNEL